MAAHKDMRWQRGGRSHVWDTYVKLHTEHKIIGQHWLWAAIERLVAGDEIDEIMRDMGYVPEQTAVQPTRDLT